MNHGSQENSYPEVMSAINVDRVPREQLAKLRDPLQLVCMILCMAVFAGLLFTIGNTILTWSVFVLGMILLCGELLTMALPRSLWGRSVANCIRVDGSWSSGRTSVERMSLSKFRLNLVFVMLLCAVPSMFGLWVLNRDVIPLGLGIDAMGAMSVDADQWKSNLRGHEQQFGRWQKSSSLASGLDADQHKRVLWHSWPLFVAGGILWCIAIFTVVAKYYIYCLRQFKASVYSRANEYRWKDLSNLPDGVSNSRRSRRKKNKQASEFA